MIELQWKPVNSSGKPILDKTGRLSSGSTLFFWFDAMSGPNFKWCQGFESTKVPITSAATSAMCGLISAGGGGSGVARPARCKVVAVVARLSGASQIEYRV